MVKLFKLIVNVIFVIIIAVLFIYFIMRVTNKVEIYNVKTGSMEDRIHVGDYILIYRKNNYQVGDVVTFIRSEGFITHRIIKMEGNKVTTKGDANNTIDEPVSRDNILGKVIIVGGILNVIINYKYAFVGILLSLYLFSCYLGDGEKEECDTSKDDDKTEKVKTDDKDENNETNKENMDNKKEEVKEENNENKTPDEEIKDGSSNNKEENEIEELKEEKQSEESNTTDEKLENNEVDENKSDTSEIVEEVPSKKKEER